MDNEYALLDTHRLKRPIGFLHRLSNHTILHRDDPAMAVLIDFTKVMAQTVSPKEKGQQALLLMQCANLKFLLVVDDQEKLVGLISSKDLQGIKPGMAAQKSSIKLTEVTVDAIMQTHENLQVIDFADLSNARIGHIARIIHEKGVENLLVTEKESTTVPSLIRGVFSASLISQYLGEDISGDLSSDNLADIQKRTTK